ncbi:uncharacterized protein LOC100846061 [Brachypodium distachyon]|uniref:Uncharacterized protein n=1 Tax=Brachypodium distachyon TaxID=15368 RepID=I1J134_BRADI|nr:uncharacterized protein LOC100846061 [Brachypodium distachyon]KQJ84272.1 hypothetical protein BRADI_5g19734v3 [Brachypodium distachyon]|eukprot:XP_003580485.1 uncharacterized protein LOC100846061 [Brachypodium distachyon]
MRCKRHPYECGVGVCASCLRDRLLALAAAQNEASSLPPAPPTPDQPAVQLFPRSVSPYVSRRKSDASVPGSWKRHPSRLFFRTPQVGPSYGVGTGFEEGDIGGFQIKPPRPRRSKLSALAALFGHRPGSKGGAREERRHGSWLAGIMPRGRRKKAPVRTASPHRRSPPRAVSDYRGLSPARCSVTDEEGSGESSSLAADSPWRPSPSPMRKAPCRRFHGGAGPGVSVCISPLVRPSSARHHRGVNPPDVPAVSGELRPSPHHRLSSLHHCRSWKLADGGRFR